MGSLLLLRSGHTFTTSAYTWVFRGAERAPSGEKGLLAIPDAAVFLSSNALACH